MSEGLTICCTDRATNAGRRRAPRAAGWLAALAVVLPGCQSIEPAKAGADWRIEPLLRVTNSAETAEAYYALGRYYQGQNRPLMAMNAYRRAVGLDARHAEAHNAIGAIAGAEGRFHEAIGAFETALAITPAAPHILGNLGHALTLAGRDAEAIAVLRRAAQQDPGNPTTRLNLALVVSRSDAVEAETTARNAVSEVAERVDAPMPGLQPDVRMNASPSGVDAETAPESVAGPAFAAAVGPAIETSSSARKRWVQVGPSELELRDVDETSVTGSRPGHDPDESIGNRAPAYRLELVNGNGVDGAAAWAGEWLERSGAPRARLRNQRPYAQATTVIYFKRGFEPQAQRLSTSFGGLAAQVEPAPLQGADVRILLGKDLMPLLARALPPSRPIGSASEPRCRIGSAASQEISCSTTSNSESATMQRARRSS